MTSDAERQAMDRTNAAATTAHAAVDAMQGRAHAAATSTQNVAQDAKDTAASSTKAMQDKAAELASQAADHADAATTTAGEKLSDVARALRGNAPTTGMVGTIAAATADTLDNAGTYLQRQDIGDMRADMTAHMPAASTITRQIADRPWTAIGIALATGYLLGSLGGDDSDTHTAHHAPVDQNRPIRRASRSWALTETLKTRSAGLLASFDDEIDMVKDAAIATVRDMLHEAVRTNIPAMSQHLDASK